MLHDVVARREEETKGAQRPTADVPPVADALHDGRPIHEPRVGGLADDLTQPLDVIGPLHARLARQVRQGGEGRNDGPEWLVLIAAATAAIAVALIVVAVTIHAATSPSVQPFTILLAFSTPRPIDQQGERFLVDAVPLSYQDGRVSLSGFPSPTAYFSIDDRIVLTVRHPDNSVSSWEHEFDAGCQTIVPIAPVDVTWMFARGQNVVSVVLSDVCGGDEGTSGPIYLTVH